MPYPNAESLIRERGVVEAYARQFLGTLHDDDRHREIEPKMNQSRDAQPGGPDCDVRGLAVRDVSRPARHLAAEADPPPSTASAGIIERFQRRRRLFLAMMAESAYCGRGCVTSILVLGLSQTESTCSIEVPT